jgi:hypothetical protein
MIKTIKQKLSKNTIYWLAIAAVALTIGVSLKIVSAWTPPTGTPPDNDTAGFINESNEGQYKSGALGIGGTFETESETHLAITGGNVGISTTTPQEKLTLNGGNFLQTSGNIDSPVASIGSISASSADVTDNADVNNNLSIGSGVNVGSGGVKSDGIISGNELISGGVIKMTATTTPGNCNTNTNVGSIYYDESLNEPCFCDGVGPNWTQFDGDGACL